MFSQKHDAIIRVWVSTFKLRKKDLSVQEATSQM
ncbi:hypothetical protein LINPERPRIM_LOCUS614 [Linum perenne]